MHMATTDAHQGGDYVETVTWYCLSWHLDHEITYCAYHCQSMTINNSSMQQQQHALI